MCTEFELVPIPEWATGPHQPWDPYSREFGVNEAGEKCFKMDACIAPAVRLLWANGFKTIGCCCGHGDGPGVISLDLGTGPYQGDKEHHCTKCGLLHVS